MIRTVVIAGLVAAVALACVFLVVRIRGSHDAAKREAERAREELAAEREGRRLAEERYTELKREKAQSNGVHRIKEKEAKAHISTLTLLSITAVLSLAVVILLLARERSLRRVVNAALSWLLRGEADHGP